MHDTRDVEISVHAILTTLHGLAALFHYRRGARFLALLHLAGSAADAYALHHHLTGVPKAGTGVPRVGTVDVEAARRAGL